MLRLPHFSQLVAGIPEDVGRPTSPSQFTSTRLSVLLELYDLVKNECNLVIFLANQRTAELTSE